jgi:hypothetical protein
MPERQAIDHATVGSDRPGIEALAPDDDVHEVEGRLGRGGEGAAPVSVSVHPRPLTTWTTPRCGVVRS